MGLTSMTITVCTRAERPRKGGTKWVHSVNRRASSDAKPRRESPFHRSFVVSGKPCGRQPESKAPGNGEFARRFFLLHTSAGFAYYEGQALISRSCQAHLHLPLNESNVGRRPSLFRFIGLVLAVVLAWPSGLPLLISDGPSLPSQPGTNRGLPRRDPDGWSARTLHDVFPGSLGILAVAEDGEEGDEWGAIHSLVPFSLFPAGPYPEPTSVRLTGRQRSRPPVRDRLVYRLRC